MKCTYRLLILFQSLIWTVWTIENPKELVKWMSFAEASKAAEKDSSKLILLDVYTNWCGPCRIMSERTFNHPEVAKIIGEHFYPVKFNAEGNLPIQFLRESYENKGYRPELANSRNSVHPFTYYIAQTERGIAYPTTTFLNYNGKEKHPVQGVIEAREFAFLLYYIAEGEYKNKINFQDFKTKNKNKVKF